MNSATTIGFGPQPTGRLRADLSFLTLGQKRLAREHQTMSAMIACYCRDHHDVRDGLCTQCQELLDYATARLERCRYGEAKPTCANCPIHCYQARRREQAKEVMRYAGPRMLWKHPILALRHLMDGYRKAPSVGD